MIDKDTAIAATQLAMVLASQGKALVPTNGTPLDALVRATESSIVLEAPPAEGASVGDILLAYADSMEYATDTRDGLTSQHDLEIDAMVLVVAPAVRHHISFARNVVKPVVQAMYETLQKSNEQVHGADSNFNINVWEMPTPLRNAGFEEAIMKYKGVSTLPPEVSLHLSAIEDPTAILKLMEKGSKEFDETLAAWYASKQSSFFLAIWDNCFRDVSISRPVLQGDISYFLNSASDKVDAALAIYLISTKML